MPVGRSKYCGVAQFWMGFAPVAEGVYCAPVEASTGMPPPLLAPGILVAANAEQASAATAVPATNRLIGVKSMRILSDFRLMYALRRPLGRWVGGRALQRPGLQRQRSSVGANGTLFFSLAALMR